MKSESKNKQKYYQSVCNFQKYFNSTHLNNKEEFISDLKSNMENYVLGKKCGDIKGEGHRLYGSSDSFIYYPNVMPKIKDDLPNVLIVSHELSRTGAPMVCLDTAKVLIKNGFFVTVISLCDGPLLEEMLNCGIPVVVMKTMKDLQYMHQETEHFVDYMDLDAFVEGFDVTLMVTATLYNFVRRYFNTERRIIWWIHEGSESYNILGSSMPRNLTSNIKVICGGKYAAFQLKNNFFNYYPDVLNYGVVDDYDPHKKRNVKNGNKVKFILAGTIGKRKGQLILLEAIEKLSLELSRQAEFIFIGDPYINDIEGEMIQKRLKEYALTHSNVVVLPSISRSELYQMYEDIDVLVIASIDDPMPVVATENLMLRNICLCSDQTGTSYYIKDKENGFVFRSGDSEELSQKIMYIIENKENLDQIKDNGRKIYERHFEMNIFEKKIVQLISGR